MMLRIDRDGPVLRLTLDRPEVRNAFNDELIAALSEVFSSIQSPPLPEDSHESSLLEAVVPPDVRVVVLSGEGKAFCAGGDLEWMRKAASYTEEENFEDALNLARLFQAIATSPAIVIAKVHGAAFGGGCGLVACADVAICEPETKFAFSEVRLGLLPATISPFVIPKIGSGNARALFSTGEAFGAERALQIGLVHEVVPMSRLGEAVQVKIKAVLAAGPSAAATAKRIALSPPMNLEDAARTLAKARSSDEGKEGVAAFLEKRKPKWAAND